MKRIFTLIALAVLTSLAQNAQAQWLNKTCGHEQMLQNMQEYEPDYYSSYNALFREYQQLRSTERGSGEDDTTYTIQVVVHVVYYNDNAYENIPDSIIASQIEALNRDYNLLNEDASETRDIFKPIIGNPKIKFVLATEKPNGQPTTGITRKKAGVDLLGRGFGTLPIFQRNVKRSSDGGTNSWDTKRYLNIWVCDLNNPPLVPGGLLGGFATPPPGLDNWPDVLTAALGGPQDQGVVLDFRFFGVNNIFSQDSTWVGRYNYGRSAIHEVGHYLGLRHIWGDLGTLDPNIACTPEASDGIDDTPFARVNYTTTITNCIDGGNTFSFTDCLCSTGNANTCDEGAGDMPDLFENFMDYSTDYCYSMFTQGQADFMRWVLTNKRPGVIVAREVETPTGVNVIRGNDNSIEVFPNPSTGKILVNQELVNRGMLQIDIFDLLGKKVFSSNITGNQSQFELDLSDLAPAMYLINFSNEEISTTERVVIKH